MTEQRLIGRRIFEGRDDLGPFHLYPNTLVGAGASLELHEHPHDHLAIFDCSIPGVIYGVEAHTPDGRVIEIETRRHAGLGVCALIAARVRHRIFLKEGERGEFCCMFSHYDENGHYLPDPKVA